MTAATDAVISGELEPTLLVRGGETLSLGGDVTVSGHAVPSHTPGSVAFAATFLPGHRLVVELSNDEPLTDAHNALLPPDAFHLPVGRRVTHKIYRDAAHPSRQVLPFTTGAA
ncbi:hypothetical protein [Streptomyces sp. CB02414]|uniref:hypothetical protein n=1 Tax=Streptomyces sp. CB02414 TaxID=1703922 RepID=UPI000B310773|nr:hypothetical protein [Streptomyces sp. CB02414]